MSKLPSEAGGSSGPAPALNVSQNYEYLKESDRDEDMEELFSKDNVAVHPSGLKADGIPGRICISAVRGSDSPAQAFLIWTPYHTTSTSSFNARNAADSETSEAARQLYAVKVPLTELVSVRRYVPVTLGLPYIVAMVKGGVAFPPYYFHEGGVREFLYALEERITMTRASEDPNLFHIGDTQALSPLHHSMSLLNIASHSRIPRMGLDGQSSSAARGPRPPATAKPAPEQTPEDANAPLSSSISSSTSSTSEDIEPVAKAKAAPSKPAEMKGKSSPAYRRAGTLYQDVSWDILGGFAKVTKLARNVQKSILNASPTNATSTPTVPAMNESLNAFEPLTSRSRTTSAENVNARSLDFSLGEGIERSAPLSQEQWLGFLRDDGRIDPSDEKEIRRIIHYGGIEESLRPEVWRYLLYLYPWGSTLQEREAIVAAKRVEFEQIKGQWKAIGPDQMSRFSKYRSRKHRIEKDVLRTDRSHPLYGGTMYPHDPNELTGSLGKLNEILLTYAFYNFDLGYVQGMSDLSSVILAVIDNDSDVFWCFKGVMEDMCSNFSKGQSGMHTQLVRLGELVALMDPGMHEFFRNLNCANMFFCFRWLLIIFKREFAFDTVIRLWEILWARHLSRNFHLFICLAILLKHRTAIVSDSNEFDDILKYVNELSGNMELEPLLVFAEVLYTRFSKMDLKDDAYLDLKEYFLQ